MFNKGTRKANESIIENLALRDEIEIHKKEINNLTNELDKAKKTVNFHN